MKSIKYPFVWGKQDYPYPEGGIIMKNTNDNDVTRIEYDVEFLMNVLDGKDPLLDFSNFPKLNREQVLKLLGVVTLNIVEITLEKKEN